MADVVAATAILSVLDELRRAGSLERRPDPFGRGYCFWSAEPHTLAFCDVTVRAAWTRGLLQGDAQRVTLRPAAEIAPIVAALETEHRADRNGPQLRLVDPWHE